MKGRMESGGLFMEGKEKKINKSMWKDERERKRERGRGKDKARVGCGVVFIE